jgi:transcriptional regulator with XRE-family HTH domain
MLNDILKKLRSEKNLSQAELANALNMPGKGSTIGMWETGGSIPTLPSLIKLADYYGVSLDFLVGRDLVSNPMPLTEDEMEINEMNRAEYRMILRQFTELTKKHHKNSDYSRLLQNLMSTLQSAVEYDWEYFDGFDFYHEKLQKNINTFRENIFKLEQQFIELIIEQCAQNHKEAIGRYNPDYLDINID